MAEENFEEENTPTPEEFQEFLDGLTEEEKEQFGAVIMGRLFDLFLEAILSHSIKRTEEENFKVDTCEMLGKDSEHNKYEVAICHKNFKEGHWIPLRQFTNRTEAENYHDKIVEKYLKEEPTYFFDILDGTIYLKDIKE